MLPLVVFQWWKIVLEYDEITLIALVSGQFKLDYQYLLATSCRPDK